MTQEYNKNDLTEGQKWIVVLYCFLLFLVIASPFMYRITNTLTEIFGWETSENGCPNLSGLLLHAVVFAILTRILMYLPA